MGSCIEIVLTATAFAVQLIAFNKTSFKISASIRDLGIYHLALSKSVTHRNIHLRIHIPL